MNVYTNPGEPGVLVCALNETVQWRKDGKIISNNEKIKIFQNVLVISAKDDEDYGSYFCELRDYKGKGINMMLIKIASENESTNFLIPFVIVLILLVLAILAIFYLVLRSRRGLASTVHRNPIAVKNEYGMQTVGPTLEMAPVGDVEGNNRDYEDVNALREEVISAQSSGETAEGDSTYQDLSNVRDADPVYQGLVDDPGQKDGHIYADAS